MVDTPADSSGINNVFSNFDRVEFARVTGYQILKSCGRGSYGEVFLVCDNVGRLSALKLIAMSSSVDKELEGIKNYASCGDTPALIKIYHVGSFKNMLYYTMELADNLGDDVHYCPATLTNVMRRTGIVPTPQAIAIMIRLLEGLEVMHRSGMVHRDIKPENIIFVRSQPKFSDVGLVRTYDNTLSLGGTPGFIPQERLNATGKNKNPRDDLYAMGKVFYCMTTGKTADDYPSVPQEIFSKDFQPINQIILKACNINPEERFSNCREFIYAIKVLQPQPASPRTRGVITGAALLAAALLGGLTAYIAIPETLTKNVWPLQRTDTPSRNIPADEQEGHAAQMDEAALWRYPLPRQADQTILLNACDNEGSQRERIMSTMSFNPPYEINAECMVHSKNNLHFDLCDGQIIFNDISEPYCLRSTIDNIRAYTPLEKVGFIQPGKFVTIRLIVKSDQIKVLVNDQERATFFGNFDFESPVGLHTSRNGKVTVKKFVVSNDQGDILTL